MGTKRVGLARTQALIQGLKRSLTMGGAAFTDVAIKRRVVNLDEATYAPTGAGASGISKLSFFIFSKAFNFSF